jgi:hypothetical protein
MEHDSGFMILFFGTPFWDGTYMSRSSALLSLTFFRTEFPGIPIDIIEVSSGASKFKVGDYWKYNQEDLAQYSDATKRMHRSKIPMLRASVDTLWDDWSDPSESFVRVANCLHFADIKYLDQVCEMTEKELLSIPNMGKTSVKKIKGLLSSKGLSLANA